MKKTKKTSTGEDESFPGYPQYPASEDIVFRAKRVEMDLDGEEQPTVPGNVSDEQQPTVPNTARRTAHSPADVTKEDLQALNAAENNFEGDDSVLEGRSYPVDFAGKDLDVPGAQLDDREEQTGDEDEENNFYSLGGENHEDLEEDRS
jgi:hypothetical protein